MELSELREIVEDHKEIALKEKTIRREIEDKIEKYMGKEEVIVIAGVRRSGKTKQLRILFLTACHISISKIFCSWKVHRKDMHKFSNLN